MAVNIYQGNDKFLKFTRQDIDGNSITTTPQALYFTVKRTESDLDMLFQKQIGSGIEQQEDGSWIIHILPEDTAWMAFGKYFCDVKVVDESGHKFTIVKPQEFNVLKVATKLENEVGA